MNLHVRDHVAATAEAGRVCPIDYTYSPAVFNRPADLAADTLYVVGGLYGNLPALAAVERLAAAERGPVTIVFNGDFHWFDAEPEWFAAIEAGVALHLALRGNVESEVARDGDIGAGCGCAYPDTVDAGIVNRSNEILSQLRTASTQAARRRLAALPMHLVARVGDLRIGLVHGDAAALAGWRFAHDALDEPSRRHWLNDIRRRSAVDAFASTHTCLAALRDFELPGGRLTVINNGASGMPNFAGSRTGLLTRISAHTSPHQPLYGLERDGVHFGAIAIEYDHAAFERQFLSRWPQDTPAHRSYYARIDRGPDYSIERARL